MRKALSKIKSWLCGHGSHSPAPPQSLHTEVSRPSLPRSRRGVSTPVAAKQVTLQNLDATGPARASGAQDADFSKRPGSTTRTSQSEASLPATSSVEPVGLQSSSAVSQKSPQLNAAAATSSGASNVKRTATANSETSVVGTPESPLVTKVAETGLQKDEE